MHASLHVKVQRGSINLRVHRLTPRSSCSADSPGPEGWRQPGQTQCIGRTLRFKRAIISQDGCLASGLGPEVEGSSVQKHVLTEAEGPEPPDQAVAHAVGRMQFLARRLRT